MLSKFWYQISDVNVVEFTFSLQINKHKTFLTPISLATKLGLKHLESRQQ